MAAIARYGGETWSSGRGGTCTGHGSSASANRRRFEGLRLFIDAHDGAGRQGVGLSAIGNSSGAVILNSLGSEYSMCR